MRDKIYDVMSSLTDLPCFFTHQNHNELPYDYVTMQEISTGVILPVHLSAIKDGKRDVCATRQAIIRLNCYCDNAFYYLDEMLLKSRTEVFLDLCQSLNVSIVLNDQIKNLPINENDLKWEQRASVDVVFNYVLSTKETVQYIQELKSKGDLKNG